MALLTGREVTARPGRRPVMLMSFFITPIFMVTLGLAQNVILISIVSEVTCSGWRA